MGANKCRSLGLIWSTVHYVMIAVSAAICPTSKAVWRRLENAAVFDGSSLNTLRTPWGRAVKAYFEGPYSGH